jgi:hypothetical protein
MATSCCGGGYIVSRRWYISAYAKKNVTDAETHTRTSAYQALLAYFVRGAPRLMGCGASKKEVQVEALPQKIEPEPGKSAANGDDDPEKAKRLEQQIAKAKHERREEGTRGTPNRRTHALLRRRARTRAMPAREPHPPLLARSQPRA